MKDIKAQEFIPHNYQEPIKEEMSENDNFGIFAFPGSGKTVLSLDRIYQLKEPTLIIAPLEVMYTTWFTENRKWEFSRKLRFTVLHGPKKDQRFFLNRGVYFINPEGIKWLVKKISSTKRFPWNVLVVDESIKFKNHKSTRFKDLCKILKTFDRRYILSGNPMPNHYLDIWAQIYILDLGKRLGSSWYYFRNKYFHPVDYNRFKWEINPYGKETIIKAISDITYFLEADDDKLPERIVVDVPIFLADAALKTYKQMEKKLFAEMEESNVIADTKSSALMKCWQIANGFLYESEERPHPYKADEVIKVRIKTHFIHDDLLKATRNIVEDLQGQPVLIGFHFIEDGERLSREYPTARFIKSGCKPGEIKKAERDWNDNKIEILLVHVAKFSHGLNLQLGEGHHILMYAMTYNYDTYDQLIRRFQRQGAEFNKVVVHRLVVQNTIHEAIIASLERKGEESMDFLTCLREYKESVGHL